MIDDKTYLRLKRQIEKEYREKLAALEVLRGSAAENGQSSSRNIGKTANKSSRTVNRTALVEDLVKTLERPFTYTDVEEAFITKHPDIECSPNFFSNVCSRLESREIIKRIKDGSGRRPAIYKYNADKDLKIAEIDPWPEPNQDSPATAWEE
ncbi:MAG: hypothetical protein KC900_09195 [Candidatus Omnitrophica bacterium]|nr:hypothetical protein [Candidatus Omnitrophota bacterium]